MLELTPQDINEESSSPKVRAGSYGRDWLGRVWVYLQASTALDQGHAVEPASYAITSGLVETAAAADTRRVHDTGVFTTTKLVDMMPDTENGHTYKLWVNAGASQGQGGPIYNRVDDDYVDVYWINSDDGKIATALTTASTFVVYSLTRVKGVASQAASRIVAYVQRQAGITDEYWFWGLSKGEGVAKLDASAQNAVGGSVVVAAAVAGLVEGVDTTTHGESHVFYAGGMAIMDQDADGLVPIIADCLTIASIQVPANLNAAYPALR